MRPILLQETNHFIAILPYAIPIAVAIISYFFNLAQLREKARLDKIEQDNQRDHDNFMDYIKNLERGVEDLRKMINDVNLQISRELGSMAVKLAEYKKDIRN